MNKSELVEALTAHFDGDKKTASAAVEGVVDTVVRTVAKGEKVSITGFGVFEKRVRAARTARNPATGAAVKVKKTSVPAFRAGQGFKDVVSGAKKAAKAVPAKKTAAANRTATKAATTRGTAKKTTTAAKKTTAARRTAASATKRAPRR